MHEETVARTGRHATGFQIWIDHADADREVPPRAMHLAAGDVPRVSDNGVTRRVLLGASGGVASPLTPPVAAGLVDMEMDAGTVFEEVLDPALNAFLWVRSGSVEIDGAEVPAGSVGFMQGGSVRALARERTRLTLFTGRPLRQDIVPAGPFVASDRSQAAAFRDRYASGAMGALAPFDQAALDHAFDQNRG
jgi:redox-sensitive bicupin YhaK (pirin superfamily)